MAYNNSSNDDRPNPFDKRRYGADESYDRENQRYSSDGGSWSSSDRPNDYYRRRDQDFERERNDWTGNSEGKRQTWSESIQGNDRERSMKSGVWPNEAFRGHEGY